MSSDSLTPNDASNDFPSPAASKSSAARSRPKRSARNLSDQQLEKKRANDREAQRAIRERTRNTITALEQRIQQLEGGQPSVEIAKALKQCDELKRENESLRQQLAHASELLSPGQVPQLAAIHTQFTGPPRYITGQSQADPTASIPSASSAHSNAWRSHVRGAKPSPPTDPQLTLYGGQGDVATSATSPHPIDQEFARPLTRPLPQQHPSHREYITADARPPDTFQLPVHLDATGAFDRGLLGIIQSARETIACGTAVTSDVLGTGYPEVAPLLNQDQDDAGGTHELCNVLCTVLRDSLPITGMAEKCGLVATVYPYLVWLIHPTQQSFDAICPHMRPTEKQMQVAHPIWIDTVQWPSLRDELIDQHSRVSVEAFLVPYCRGLRTDWKPNATTGDCIYPYRRTATKLDEHRRELDGYTTDYCINDSLIEHVYHLENWSLNTACARALPLLASLPSFVLLSPRKVTYENRPIPQLTPHDVLITIKYTGICGSDVHYWAEGQLGDFVVRSPMVLGHESSGIVSAVGDAVTTLRPGDPVAVEPGIPCRRCGRCKEGAYNLCKDTRFAATPPIDGTLARYYAVPADFCYKLPSHMTLEEGALIEPLAVAVHVVRQAPVTPGMDVVVYGAGPVGLLCMAVARSFGASTVTAVDVNYERLDFAGTYAATHTFKPAVSESPAEASRRLRTETGLDAGANVAIEATGAEPCAQQAAHVLGDHGVYVQAGMGKPELGGWPIAAMMGKEVLVKTSFRYKQGDYELAVKLVSGGKVDVRSLVTGVVGFKEAERAFGDTRASKGVKTLIRGPE